MLEPPSSRVWMSGSVDEWERPFTLASLREACGQDNTPFRALLSPTSVAGNYHARGERHSVGSRPEKVCVMEVMGCSDLEAEFVLDAVPSLLQAGVRIIRGVLVYALRWTSWRCGSVRGGVAGGWGWARETYIARKMGGGTSQKRQECGLIRFIFGSPGFNKQCCFD